MKYYLILVILFVQVIANAQKVRFGLNLQKGTTYHHHSTAVLVIGETINGKEINISTTVEGTLDFKVVDIKDGIFYTQAAYTDLGMKMQVPGQAEMAFKADKDKTDIMSQTFTQMINKPFSVSFTSTGKIHSLEGIENLVSGIFDKYPQLSEAQKTQIKNQMLKSFGNDSFKGNIEMTTAIFPDVPVEKNSKWVINTVLNSTVQADIITNYKLVDIKDNDFSIHGDGIVTARKGDAYAEINGFPMKFEMTGTMTSDIKTDKTTGWIIESKLVEVIKGTAFIKDNDKVPGGMTMPMTIDSQITTIGN